VKVWLGLVCECFLKVLSKAFVLNKQNPWNETVYVAFFAVYLPDPMLEHRGRTLAQTKALIEVPPKLMGLLLFVGVAFVFFDERL
jgi:hypothetical protein